MATSSYGALEASEGGAFEKEADAVHQTVTNEKRTTVLSRIVSTISVVMLTVVLMIATKLLRNEQNTIRTQSFKSSGRNDLSVEFVSNEYGKLDLGNMLPYSFLVGAVLLEPYRATIIAIEDPLDGCSYDWTITELSSDVISASGNSLDGTILATLQTVGEYRLSAKESCGAASDSKRSLNVKVWLKYVRRELSSLNDEDREEFLDAFHSLWTTSTTDGKALYGDRYKSLNYFATLHNDAGGNSVCDQFHGGYGFLSNHMYLSAYLEQSLQLINPKMALHYMEYSQYFESDKFQARKYLSD